MLKAGRYCSFRFEFALTTAASCGVRLLAKSTSPVCSACTRALVSEIGRTMTVFVFAFGPQYFSFRTSTSLSPIFQDWSARSV
jgi:hypothetical protein